MKRKDAKLNKNISRLVKLTRDNDMPSGNFTENLINDAMKELKAPGTDRKRDQRRIPMRRLHIRILSTAAIVFVIAALSVAIMMPSLGKEKLKPGLDISGGGTSLVYENVLNSEDEFTAGTSAKIDAPAPQAPVAVKNETFAFVQTRGVAKGEKTKMPAMMPGMGVPATGGARGYGWQFDGKPAEVSAGHGMAHGGSAVPNGEDVDAMFFKNYGVNPFIDTEDDHLSTFATDVDTGSYTIARAYLQDGNLPPNDAVRVEEFVNYFDYGYEAPQEETFAVFTHAEPWSFGQERKNSYLMKIGLKAMEVSDENRKPAVLTFVIDVSGSMNREDRLGLVKKSLIMLIDKLRPDDKIGIAVYGSQGHKVLYHKSLSDKESILKAIRSLRSEGSTYAEEGIRIGYEMAEDAFTPGCINRVILCSDGVANVGNTGTDKILEIIKDKAAKGITLSSLGFGMGNYNDVLLEQLGNKGDGYYAYIDTIAQAKRLFSNLTGALQVVARDVKVQVDFNPEVVRSYRLIGYENRDVPDEKFRDDKYDGGEVGAGHSVTALYELKLIPEKTGAIAETYVRYKHPETREVTEIKSTFETEDMLNGDDLAGWDFELARTVTEFSEILRKSYWAKGASLDDTLARATNLIEYYSDNEDVIELVDLIAKAKNLWPEEE